MFEASSFKEKGQSKDILLYSFKSCQSRIDVPCIPYHITYQSRVGKNAAGTAHAGLQRREYKLKADFGMTGT